MSTYLIVPVRLFYQEHDALKEPAVSTAAVQHGLFWSQSVSTAPAGSWLPHISCSAGAVRMKRVVMSCIKSGDGVAILSRLLLLRDVKHQCHRCTASTALGSGQAGRGPIQFPSAHHRVWGPGRSTGGGHFLACQQRFQVPSRHRTITLGCKGIYWATSSVESHC